MPCPHPNQAAILSDDGRRVSCNSGPVTLVGKNLELGPSFEKKAMSQRIFSVVNNCKHV